MIWGRIIAERPHADKSAPPSDTAPDDLSGLVPLRVQQDGNLALIGHVFRLHELLVVVEPNTALSVASNIKALGLDGLAVPCERFFML